MATIGLDNLYYAPITEDENGDETYGTPVRLAKAISAGLSVSLAEATIVGADGNDSIIREFQSGQLVLSVADLTPAVAAVLTGATIDGNGVLVSTRTDDSTPVAIGFRTKKTNGKYRYYWLYRVVFVVPGADFATNSAALTLNTPTIVGTISPRNKSDFNGKKPWKSEIEEGSAGVSSAVVAEWFNAVYEPLSGGTIVPSQGCSLPSPSMSVASGSFFLSITTSVIRPDAYEDMIVYYYINGDDSVVYRHTGAVFTIKTSQSITLFGRVGDEVSNIVIYNYIIEQPHFADNTPIKIEVAAVSDAVQIGFRDVTKKHYSDEISIQTEALNDNVEITII